MSGPRIVVAGVGNLFLGDDGFGPEVARRLAGMGAQGAVEIVDVGLRSFDLAFRLADGCGLLIVVDLVPPRDGPGTLHLIDVDPSRPRPSRSPGPGHGPHGLDLHGVLAMARALGGEVERVLVVGCEPESEVVQERIGLGPAVRAAVEPAARLVWRLIEEARGGSDEAFTLVGQPS